MFVKKYRVGIMTVSAILASSFVSDVALAKNGCGGASWYALHSNCFR
jgi:hypothetical protein